MLNTQFQPNIEDIQNDSIKDLANRLKADSIEKSLTNVLEWQDRNLSYWTDRASLFIILYILLVISSLLLPLPNQIKFIISAIIVGFAFFDLIFIAKYLITIIIPIILLFGVLFTLNLRDVGATIFTIIFLATTLGGILTLIIYLMTKYRNIKEINPNFKLEDTFKLSLPTKKIIDFRLAICRDYAKLTMGLLYNLYPKNKLYFLLIPSHVATAIKIKGKIYVLDQRLPIYTLENWLQLWQAKFKKKKLEAELLEFFIKDKKTKTRKIKKIKINNNIKPIFNTKQINKNILNCFDLINKNTTNEQKIEIPLHYLAYCNEHDAIINCSIIRLLIKKINEEFCSNVKKINNIKIKQDSEKIVLIVYFSD
jgi:predicted transglutaminase-like protease